MVFIDHLSSINVLIGSVMSNLAYQQLNDFLANIQGLKTITSPAKGWVRAIRNGLGMSRRQLANRLSLSVSRIQRLEQDEVTQAVTLKTMRRTAEALDCVFVYALIPASCLDETLQKQAMKKAKEHLQSVNHTMALEDQSLDDHANQEMVKALAQQLINESKRTLWDD